MSKIFQEELNKLEAKKAILSNHSDDHKELERNFGELIDEYKDLLDQATLMTKVSDRLQNKLDSTNEKLKVTNVKLKHTIELLDDLKISRKASTIVWLGALSMFFLSELVIEPSIAFIANNYWMGVSLKCIIALLIKPVEGLIEEKMKKQRKKEIYEIAEKEVVE